MPLSIQEFKEQNPAYKDVEDSILADKLHQKYYKDIPKEDFYKQISFTPNAPEEEGSLIGNYYRGVGKAVELEGKLIKAAVGGIASIPAGVAEVVHAGGDKLADTISGDNFASSNYGQSNTAKGFGVLKEEINRATKEASDITGRVGIPFTDIKVGGGEAANITGQAIGSMGGLTKLGTAVAGNFSKVLGAGRVFTENAAGRAKQYLTQQLPAWLSGAGAAGGAGGAIQPTGGATPDETLKEHASNAKVGAILGPIAEAGIAGIGKVASVVRDPSGAKNIAEEIGKELKTKLSPQEKISLEETATNNPRGYTTAEATLNPDVAKLQREVASAVPIKNADGSNTRASLELGQKTQSKKDTLAKELQVLGVSGADETGAARLAQGRASEEASKITAPLKEAESNLSTAQEQQSLLGQLHDNSVNGKLRGEGDQVTAPGEAAEATGMAKLAQDTANTKTIREAYAKVDPDKVIPTNSGKIKDTVDSLKADEELADSLKDPSLIKVLKNYSEGTTPTAGQMVEDNAALSAILKEKYLGSKNTANPNRSSDYRDYQAVTKVKQALEDSLMDSPAGTAYASAKQSVKDIESAFYDNTNITNASGKSVDSALVGSKEKLSYADEVQPANIGEQLFNPKTSKQVFSNLKNIENGPELLKEQALSNIASKIKDTPTVKAFDEAYPKELQNGFLDNGMKAQHEEILATREALRKAEGNIKEQEAILTKAKADSDVRMNEFEKTAAYKLSKLSPEDFSKGILKDKSLREEALKLAREANDGGASLRGIGKVLVDEIKSNIKTTKGMRGEAGPDGVKPSDIGEIDHAAFKKALDEHAEVLQQTIPDEYKALQAIEEIAARYDYVDNYSKPADGSSGQKINPDPETPGDTAFKEIANKLGLANAVVNSINRVFGSYTKNARNKLLYEATDPVVANQLLKAAEKGEQGVKDWVTNHNVAALTPIVRENSTEKKLDKEVNSVLKSKKSGGNNAKPNTGAPNRNAPNSPSGSTPVGKTPQVGPQSSASPIENKQAASVDNHDENVKLASKMSGMPPKFFKMIETSETKGHSSPDTAKNPTKGSTATGRYQFTEKTWNYISDKYPEAKIPKITPGNDPRTDPKWSAMAVGYLGKDNKEQIKTALTRPVTYSDVVFAHKFGSGGFKKLMKAPPGAAAASIVPDLVKGNESLFYDPKGKARSVKQLYALVEKTTS